MLRSFAVTFVAIVGAVVHLVLWWNGLASELDILVYTVIAISVVSFTLFCED